MGTPQKTETTPYNGWKNYETWNIALWINGDMGLYDLATQSRSYDDFVQTLRELGIVETSDGVAFNDSRLDREELNELIQERA